eukprot:6253067-Prymnesium_polylepis.2
MTSEGASATWTKELANHVNVGNAFLTYLGKHDAELGFHYGTKWDDVPEEQMCTQELFGYLATYLAETHRIEVGNRNAGRLFDKGTADTVWGGLIQNAKKRFGKSKNDATKMGAAPLPLLCTLHRCRSLFAVCNASRAPSAPLCV